MTTVRVADLIGSRVIASDGTHRGKVVDIVVSDDDHLHLLFLVIGTIAWIDRLNMASMLRAHDSADDRRDRVPWDEVDRWDVGRVYLK